VIKIIEINNYKGVGSLLRNWPLLLFSKKIAPLINDLLFPFYRLFLLKKHDFTSPLLRKGTSNLYIRWFSKSQHNNIEDDKK
jgi:hypothetical protein